MKEELAALDTITSAVLAYRPADKGVATKKPKPEHEWMALPHARFSCPRCASYVFDPTGKPDRFGIECKPLPTHAVDCECIECWNRKEFEKAL